MPRSLERNTMGRRQKNEDVRTSEETGHGKLVNSCWTLFLKFIDILSNNRLMYLLSLMMPPESSNSYGWEPLNFGVGEVDSISSGKVSWLAGESSFYVWNTFSRSISHCYLSLPECRRCSNFMVIRVRISTQSNCSTGLLWLWLLLLLVVVVVVVVLLLVFVVGVVVGVVVVVVVVSLSKDARTRVQTQLEASFAAMKMKNAPCV